MDDTEEKVLLSAGEMAERLGWSTARTLRYAHRGYLPGVRHLGSRVYFSVPVVERFLNGDTAEPPKGDENAD